MREMNIIETKDYCGILVTCSTERWDTHIVDGHPEMVGKEHNVAGIISDPQLIKKQSSDRKVYFNRDALSVMPPLYTKVVVEYSEISGVTTGTVITAYITKKLGSENENSKIEIRRF